jgi:hypothetical protein
MNWILEYFENKTKVTQAAERMDRFFSAIPELRPMGDCYAAAIASESAMSVVAGETDPRKIPKNLDTFLGFSSRLDHTSGVLSKAAELMRPLCVEYGVKFTPDYPELVRRLCAVDPACLRLVHGAYISDLMATEYLLHTNRREAGKVSIRDSCHWLFSRNGFELKPLLINAWIVMGFDIPIFAEKKIDQLRDGVLIKMVERCPGKAKSLCGLVIDRPAVLEQMVTNGFFPKDLDDMPFTAVVINRQLSLRDALSSLLKCSDSDVYEAACLRGLIKRNTITEVIKAADCHRLKRVLAGLYTKQELLPWVTHDHIVKGLLLEDELGL